MPNTASRLITLIMLLERQPNQKAADLAQELGVSVRTLHRYFGMLDEIGIPVYSERGRQGGFSLVKGYRMPPLVFTSEEAVAVYLGVSLVEEMWGQIYQQAARGALAKLDNVLPDQQRHEVAWARRSLVSAGMHRMDLDKIAPILESLRRAAREHRQMNISYQSPDKVQPNLRNLDPYVLLHRWGWWYVIGFCHLRQEIRTFRLDRITKFTLTDSLFDPPIDFDLVSYLNSEPQTQPKLQATLRFIPDAARVAEDGRAYWETLEVQADGAVIVTFSAPTLQWAASTTLAYGPIVQVLDPPELQSIVQDWAAAVADKYQHSPQEGT